MELHRLWGFEGTSEVRFLGGERDYGFLRSNFYGILIWVLILGFLLGALMSFYQEEEFEYMADENERDEFMDDEFPEGDAREMENEDEYDVVFSLSLSIYIYMIGIGESVGGAIVGLF